MKEKEMTNPNSLGHYHRDIVKTEVINNWHMKVTMSCNHSKQMSRAAFRKHGEHATLCPVCSHSDEVE